MKNLRTILVAVGLISLLLLVTMAGCSSKQSPSPASSNTSEAKGTTASAPNWPTTVEEIALYNKSDRNEMLLAKAEKEVNLYTSENVDNIQPILDQFMKKYSGIKVNLLRLDSDDLVPKILSETSAGRNTIDVVSTGFLKPLIEQGLMQNFNSPEAQQISNELKHPNGLWVGRHTSNYGFAYNPKLVPPERVPKTWEDLTDPWWKDKLIIEPWDDKFYIGILHMMGEEKGWKWIEDIAANSKIIKGKTQKVDAVIAGEYAGALVIYLYRPAEKKYEKGAPIDYVVFNPTITSPHMLGMMKKAPNPFASMLLIDFLLSKEGQQAVADGGRVVVRSDVVSKKEHINDLNNKLSKVKRVTLQEEWYDDTEKVNERVFKIFGVQ